MSWRELPTEVCLMIISHWAADAVQPSTSCGFRWPLSMFANLSSDWQRIVEEYTFADIALVTRDLLSGTAMEYLSHRLGHVKKLVIKVSFSNSHIDEPCPCPDCIIDTIFTLLNSAPSTKLYPHISLSIELEPRATPLRYAEWIGMSQPLCFRTRMDEQCLPEAPAVRSLTISAPSGLLFIPSSACRIASRMTKLASFQFTGNWCNAFPGRLAILVERESRCGCCPIQPSQKDAPYLSHIH